MVRFEKKGNIIGIRDSLAFDVGYLGKAFGLFRYNTPTKYHVVLSAQDMRRIAKKLDSLNGRKNEEAD